VNTDRPKYGDGGQWPRGYGADVKRIAREIEQNGVGTLDSSTDPLLARRMRSRATGYVNSLNTIFGGGIESGAGDDEGDGPFFWFGRVEA